MPTPRYAATNTVAMYSLYFPRLPRPVIDGVFIIRNNADHYAMPALVRDVWRANRKEIGADILGDASVADNTDKVVVEPDGSIVVAMSPTAWARLTAAFPFVEFDADTPELVKAAEEAEMRRLKLNPALPSLFKQAKNLATSVTTWIADGAPRASTEVYESRLAICKTCPSYDANGFGPALGRCRECGCSGAKLHMETAQCPLMKW
jgi:hypothetical protein